MESAHELRYNQIRVWQVVGTTLRKPTVLSGLARSLFGVGVLLMRPAVTHIRSDR